MNVSHSVRCLRDMNWVQAISVRDFVERFHRKDRLHICGRKGFDHMVEMLEGDLQRGGQCWIQGCDSVTDENVWYRESFGPLFA